MKTVTLIGSGNMAEAIGSRIANAGYVVEVMSRDASKAQALASKLGSPAKVGGYKATPAGAIVVLAIPYTHAAEVVREYGESLAGCIIIDITNPVNSTATGLVTAGNTSGAEELAKVAPRSARIVKAMNTLFGHVLAKGAKLDAFVAADDADAKAKVESLLAEMGLRPFDVGALPMARTLEALGLMMIGAAKNGAGTFDLAIHLDLFNEKNP